MCCSPQQRAIKQERKAELKALKAHYKQERKELKNLLKSLKRSSKGPHCQRRAMISISGKEFDTRSTKQALSYALSVLDEQYKLQRSQIKSSYRDIRRSLSLTPVSSTEKKLLPSESVKPVVKVSTPPPEYTTFNFK